MRIEEEKEYGRLSAEEKCEDKKRMEYKGSGGGTKGKIKNEGGGRE